VLKVLLWEHKVLKERQVLKEIKELKVPFKVLKVLQDQQVLKEFKELKVV
jgi:hypothetical protein